MFTPKSPKRGPFYHIEKSICFFNKSATNFTSSSSVVMKTRMHFGASKRVFINARALRKNPTFAEILLWSRLRNNKLGYHFRRQHPTSNFVVDFFCLKLMLVVEVDGSYHANKIVQIEDQCKEESLESYEMDLIRFTNDEVINNIDKVMTTIKSAISVIEENGLPSRN